MCSGCWQVPLTARRAVAEQAGMLLQFVLPAASLDAQSVRIALTAACSAQDAEKPCVGFHGLWNLGSAKWWWIFFSPSAKFGLTPPTQSSRGHTGRLLLYKQTFCPTSSFACSSTSRRIISLLTSPCRKMGWRFPLSLAELPFFTCLCGCWLCSDLEWFWRWHHAQHLCLGGCQRLYRVWIALLFFAFWSLTQLMSPTATFLCAVCHLVRINRFGPASWLPVRVWRTLPPEQGLNIRRTSAAGSRFHLSALVTPEQHYTRHRALIKPASYKPQLSDCSQALSLHSRCSLIPAVPFAWMVVGIIFSSSREFLWTALFVKDICLSSCFFPGRWFFVRLRSLLRWSALGCFFF